MTKCCPSIEFLHECFDLDHETGSLTWRARPRDHFDSDFGFRVWTGQHVGKVAGTEKPGGYRMIVIKLDGKERSLKAHRIVWAMVNGRWPEHAIDHINRNKADNSPVNLREASHGENRRNIGVQRNNRSGLKGVCIRGGRYHARIMLDKKRIFLGTFGSAEEASAAYRAAAAIHHGEFSCD